jgi:thiamine-phosphate pyrophosphorylase
MEEAIEAEALGADYLVYGHVHATASHPGEPGQGIAALAGIVERIERPVLAIGGINHANVNEVLATGCAGVSVVSAIADHADPGEAARRLLAAIASSNAEPRLRLEPLPTSTRKGSSH